MSRPACHCRSRPVTTECHGLTHSESRGPGLPAASTPLAGGRGVKAARARRGGRDGGRGQWGPGNSPRCEAAARDSLMGGGGMLMGLAVCAGDALCWSRERDSARPGALRGGGSLLEPWEGCCWSRRYTYTHTQPERTHTHTAGTASARAAPRVSPPAWLFSPA